MERNQAFESMTIPHVNALFQTALHLTGHRAAAEDLVHEVYGYARKSFRRREKPPDWRVSLFKILIERARRRPADPTEGDVAAITGIPRALREIILLVDGQDFSYQQAADILEFSRETVEEGVIRGRTRLETTFPLYCDARP